MKNLVYTFLAGLLYWSLTGCSPVDRGQSYKLTLEVQFADIVRTVSNNPRDVALNKALNDAEADSVNKYKVGFTDRFRIAFERNNPGSSLAPLFLKPTNTLSRNASNDEVLQMLNEKLSAATKRTAKVLEYRLNTAGLKVKKTELDEVHGIINLELRDSIGLERLEHYTWCGGNLRFFETYTNQEIGPMWEKVNDKPVAVRSLREARGKLENSYGRENNVGKSNTNAAMKDSDMKAKYPLFNVMVPNADSKSGQLNPGPVVGFVAARDVHAFLQIVNMDEIKAVLPMNARIYLGPADPKNPKAPRMVYAVKMPLSGEARLNGDHVIDTRATHNPLTGQAAVDLELDAIGAHIWKEMTYRNIGHYLAVELDDVVYSCPRVEGEIAGGEIEISGSFTEQEAHDLASILKAGRVPARVVLLKAGVGK